MSKEQSTQPTESAQSVPTGEALARIAIVSDEEGHWYVRRVRLVEHDLDRDEKVYRCDEPLGGPYSSLANVPMVASATVPTAEAPTSFADWWDREDYGDRTQCERAYNAALATAARGAQISPNSTVPESALYWLRYAKVETYSMAERLFFMENAYNHAVNALVAAVPPSTADYEARARELLLTSTGLTEATLRSALGDYSVESLIGCFAAELALATAARGADECANCTTKDVEVRAVLDILGLRAVRVREDGGPEDIYASLAVTVSKLARGTGDGWDEAMAIVRNKIGDHFHECTNANRAEQLGISIIKALKAARDSVPSTTWADKAIAVLVKAKEGIKSVGKQGRSARNAETQRRQAIYIRGWDDAMGALEAARDVEKEKES